MGAREQYYRMREELGLGPQPRDLVDQKQWETIYLHLHERFKGVKVRDGFVKYSREAEELSEPDDPMPLGVVREGTTIWDLLDAVRVLVREENRHTGQEYFQYSSLHPRIKRDLWNLIEPPTSGS